MIGSTESRPAPFLTRFTGEVHERSTVYSILCSAGGCQRAERLTAVRVGVGVVAVCNTGAAMSDVLGTIIGAAVALIIGCLFLDED